MNKFKKKKSEKIFQMLKEMAKQMVRNTSLQIFFIFIL